MSSLHIGFLHPGAMGISLAATASNSGHVVHWVSDGRSAETRERAREHGLEETRSIQELADRCSVIISVCPPHAAVEVAAEVAGSTFSGVYADVNAIAPDKAVDIGRSFNKDRVRFVDGGIVGGPAWKPDTTVLYLSGEAADAIASCFAAGPLATRVIGTEIGKASALKMCYAARTKGTAALTCAVVAAAESLGVRDELEKQWSHDDPGSAERTLGMVSRVTAKAWRFSGEMQEIASTFESAGLPNGFHLAAADLYDRMAGFKGADPLPDVEAVIRALLESHPNAG